MNHSAETLRRYLRNFDPINESMFRPPNQFSEDSVDEVNADQPEIGEEPVKPVKATYITEGSRLEEELDGKLKQLLKREEELQKENLDQQNKIHMLAEHVSALEFENEQISHALRKNSKAYKSLKSSRGEVTKSRSNSNAKAYRGGCDKCGVLTDELGKIIEVINGFIAQFSELFLKENTINMICDNFRRLLLRHSSSKVGDGLEGREFSSFSQLSEWLLVLFEQIDFQNQLCCGYRERVEALVAENDALAANVNNLESERHQLQHHIETIMQEEKEAVEDEEDSSERQDQLLEIIRLAVHDIDLRHRIGEYISFSFKRQQQKKTLQAMTRNLNSFKLSYNSTDRQFAKEVRFKEGFIEKTREDLERAEGCLTRLYKSIVSSLTVKQKESSLKSILQNRQHKITQSQTVKTNTHLTERSTNRLYEQIVKHDLGSECRPSDLSRQSSLHQLRRKIQQVDSASRMLSNKLSVKIL